MSEVNRGAGAAKAMYAYATVMLLAGIVAFVLAPEGAKAGTALAVPAGCAFLMMVCGLLSMAIHKSKVAGMIGIHLGLVLPLLFASVIGMRAVKTSESVTAYQSAAAKWDERVLTGAAAEDRAAHFETLEAPDHDKSYLRNTLWFLCGASGIAFFVILSRRPKKEDRGG